ncbi:MxaP protein [Methylomonas sp. AM2-LC]|uniref:MxaP protein n=1 Tax=Methylomonas sp. AM2-LC TaxID=3153301 RepID=UPI0032653DC4
MNTSNLIKNAIPQSGLGHWAETYLTWSGVGLIGSFIANILDKEANLSYAAFYTSAVNDAIGYNFWVLLSVIGVLLFLITLPMIYLSTFFPKILGVTDHARRLTYTFFLVAFDEGCLMIGILTANFLHTSERISLLATKSFLFSNVGFFSILVLAFINSLLWLLGESIYNRNDKAYSGIVNIILNSPVRYLAPLYLMVAGVALYLIIKQ